MLIGLHDLDFSGVEVDCKAHSARLYLQRCNQPMKLWVIAPEFREDD